MTRRTAARLRSALGLIAISGLLVTCRLSDLVTSPPLPVMNISAAKLEDSAAVGSLAPRTMTATIANTGGGQLVWTIQSAGGSDWLGFSDTTGTVPATITASLDPTGLARGAYRDTLVIRDNFDRIPPVRIAVLFAIQPCRDQAVSIPADVTDALGPADCTSPHRADRFTRAFRMTGSPGDSVSVLVTSSDFDPHILVTSSLDSGVAIGAETTACAAQSDAACVPYFRFATTDPVFVEVTTDSVGETGAFTLSISPPRDPTEPTALSQFARDSVTPLAVGDTAMIAQFVIAAALGDPDPADTLALVVEIQPVGTPFTGTPTASSDTVPAGDTAIVRVTGLADNTGFHWQARSVDQTGRAGPWTSFGNNPETDPDVIVTVADSPFPPVLVGQFESDQITPIALGGTIGTAAAAFRAVVSDPDPTDQVRLEVELRPVVTAFTDTPTHASVAVASDDTAGVVAANLADDTDYHWQARTIDQDNNVSPWVTFGGNTEGDADFTIFVHGTPSPPADLAQLAHDGTVLAVGDTSAADSVRFAAVVTDPDPGDVVRLEVEVKPLGTAFNNVPTDSSSAVNSGDTATVTVAGLNDDTDYHWHARAVDQDGNASSWVSFGTNPEADRDFRLQIPAATLQFTSQPPNASAGTTIAPAIVVEAREPSGTTDTAFTEVVQIAITPGTGTSGAVLSGTTPVTAVAGVATFADLAINRAGSGYTLTASVTGLPDEVSNVFDIMPGGVDHLVINGQPPATAQSGVPAAQPAVVQLEDASGNPVALAGVLISASVASGPAGATVTPDTNSTDGLGQATFDPLTITGTVGDYTLAFSASGLAAVESDTVTVSAGPAAGLMIVSQPSDTVRSRLPFPQQPAIQIVDGAGNPVAQAGAAVAASVASGGATLSGVDTVTTDPAGTATFVDLTLSGTVGPHTLRFESSPLTGTTSDTVELRPGLPDRIAVSAGDNQVAVAGNAVAIPPAVLVIDADSNGVPGDTVTFAIASGGGSVNPTGPVITNGSGIAAATSWTLGTAVGANTLTATSRSSGVNGNPVTFTATAMAGSAGQIVITQQPSATASSGVPFGQQPIIAVQDTNGNPVTQSGIALRAAVSSGTGGTLIGTVADTTDVNGVLTYTDLGLSGPVGSYTISFSDTLGQLTGVTAATIMLGAGAADPSTSTASVQAGAAGAVTTGTVVVRDGFGNGRTGGGENVVASVIAGSANPGLAVAVADLGDSTYTLSYTPVAAGVDSLAITLNGAAIAGSPYPSQVAPGAPAPSQSTATVPSGAAGDSTVVAVIARDAFGNGLIGGGQTVTLNVMSGSPNAGAASNVVDNGDSTYTITYRPTLVGTDSLMIALNGSPVAGSPFGSTVQPGGPGPATSVAMVANGTAGDSTTITVTARDSLGNSLAGGGQSVALTVLTGSANAGAASNVVDNLDSTYTITYRPTTTGLDSLAIALNGVRIGGGPYTSTIVPSVPEASTTTAAIPSGNAGDSTVITVTARDSLGNGLTGGGQTVALSVLTGSPNAGAGSNVVDNGDSTYTVTYRPTVTGTDALAITLNGAPISNSPFAATVNPGGPGPANSTAQVSNGTAGDSTTILVTARDSLGNSLTGGGQTVALTVLPGSPNAGASANVVDNGDSTYTVRYRPTAAGTDTLEITLNGSPISGSPYLSTVLASTGMLVITTQPSAIAQNRIPFPQQPVVQVQDTFGNPVLQSGTPITAFILSGSPTLGGITSDTTDTQGMVAFTDLRITGIVGNRTLTFVSSGLNAPESDTVTVTPGNPSPSNSSASVAAGTAGVLTTLTVTARDSSNNGLINGGQSVAVTVTAGSPNDTVTVTVTDNGDSTYTATYTPRVTGIDGLTITLNGTAVGGGPYQSTVAPGGAGPANSIAVIPPTGAAGDSTIITVTARDSLGNSLTGGGETVALTVLTGSANAGAGANVVDNGDSTYTITYRPTVTGLDSVAITLGGIRIGGGPYTSTVGPGGPGPANSIAVVPPTGAAGDSTIISVTARDSLGNSLTGGGQTVALTVLTGSANAGAGANVVDNGDSTYTITYRPTVTGLDSVAIALGGVRIGGGPYTSAVGPGGPGPANSIAVVPTTGTAGDSTIIAVTARDSLGNSLTGGGQTVALTVLTGSANAGAGSNVVDNGDSTYTITYQPTVAGLDSVAITLGGTRIGGGPYTSTVAPGSPDSANTTAVVPLTGAAGDSTIITVTARDSLGNGLTGGGETVALTVLTGSANASAGANVVDNGDSTYTITYRPTVTGLDSLAITLGGVRIGGGPYTSTVGPGGPGPANSTAVVPTTGTAGDSTIIAVTARDSLGNSLTGGGQTVALTVLTGSANAGAGANVVDNGDSTYTVTYRPTTTGLDSVAITLGGVRIGGGPYTSTVGPGGPGPANSVAVVPPTGTAGDSTIITVTARDSLGNSLTGGGETVAFTVLTGSANAGAGANVVDNGDSTYTITYRPTVTGLDSVAITLNGVRIGGGPYTSSVASSVATTLVLTGLSNPFTLGATENITVTAMDSLGNVATGYLGTVTFTSTDGSAVLPADYTFQSGDGGAHIFVAGVSLNSPGMRSVTATDTSDATITGTLTVMVQ